MHPREFAPWIDWKLDFNAIDEAQDQTVARGLEQIMEAREVQQSDG